MNIGNCNCNSACYCTCIITQADDENVRPLPLVTHCQLRKYGAYLSMLTGTANPEFAGLILRGFDHELLAAWIICRLCFDALQVPTALVLPKPLQCSRAESLNLQRFMFTGP
jgi:hypothetical protein